VLCSSGSTQENDQRQSEEAHEFLGSGTNRQSNRLGGEAYPPLRGDEWRGWAYLARRAVALADHRRAPFGQTASLGAVLCATDAARYVVVASKGGADEHPDWYRNLLHTPAKLVPKLADIFRATARTATPSEHARLWPRLVELFPLYASYQRKTSRPIPLVILERV
jgi:deazaflavin-dependent oxidoreductase (nitroreductase family)